MQARRNGPRTRGIDPVEVNESGRGGLRSRWIYGSGGCDCDGEQHGTEAPSRHVAGHDCIGPAICESGLNMPRGNIAAHPALQGHTLNKIRTWCNIFLH
jgi:hypothetical protein